MKVNAKILLMTLGGAALVAGSVWVIVADGGKDPGVSDAPLVCVRKNNGQKPGAKQVRKRVGARRRIDGKPMTDSGLRKRPTFDIGAVEEAKLTVEQKKLLEEIRAALKVDNWRKLTKLVQKLQALDEWPDGVPVAIRRAAIDALSFYGAKCLPEVVGFMSDADSEIVDAATESFWDSVTDPDLSDLEIETNLLAAMKVIRNEESIKSMLSEVITTSMRNSRAVDTVKKLMAYDNKAIRDELPSVIEELTEDPNVKTAQQLDEWLKKHPDEPDDEDMYGGMKDEDE